MGMLATVMNALAMQSALEKVGVQTRVQSAIPMAAVCEPYIRRRAIRHLEKGRVVIFAAGTGNPFFTTDTAAALRAAEMGCDALLKGTRSTASTPPTRRRTPTPRATTASRYLDVLAKDLKVMDASAIAWCATTTSRSSCSRSTRTDALRRGAARARGHTRSSPRRAEA